MSSIPSKKLFVFGLGYSASRAAHAFHSIGYQVSGTVRSIDTATQLCQSHYNLFRLESSATHPQNVFLFDGITWNTFNSLSLENALHGVTHVLISVPPGCSGGHEDPVLSALGNPLILAMKTSVQWVGYLSTIGVYGETHGVEVDESAPVGSSVGRCQMRIKAERLWLNSGLPTHVFRIAGIYGPGRGTLTRVRSGTASRIYIPGRKFNRIHVDDIVNVLLASAARPHPGGIYNICDDEPTPSDEVTAYACELLGVHVPPRLSWEEAEKTMSAMAKSFYAESKICANRRIKKELGVQLIYPTYREGFLAQMLEEDKLARHDVLPWTASKAHSRLVVLVNAGSLQAKPYLDLRQISFRLSQCLGQLVVPCSFQFSDRVDPRELNWLNAKTFEMVLTDHLVARGKNASEVIVLPLFVGKCSTLTKFLPETVDKVCAATLTPMLSAPLTVRVSGCLVNQDNVNDPRVAEILVERIQDVVDLETIKEDVYVLAVEHSMPNRDVHESREFVVPNLRNLLQRYECVKKIDTAYMGRYEGAEYDSNDPHSLAQALDHSIVKDGIVVCAIKMLLSNDRHAGASSGIEEIIKNVKARHPNVDVRVTEALGTHKLLSEIMQDRYRAVLTKEMPDYRWPKDK